MTMLAPRSLYVLAASFRTAERVLAVDMRIHPKNPAIRIVVDVNHLRGLARPTPVLLVNPLADSNPLALREYEAMKKLGYFRDWTDAERALVSEAAE